MWNVIVGGITSLVSGWFETKKQKQQAKADYEKSQLESVSSYDIQAQKNMQTSWKDEYLILLHTLPIWGYVIPSETLHKSLDTLWLKLETAPDYWWLIYIGMVVSTFGLRWMIQGKNVMSIRKGNGGK